MTNVGIIGLGFMGLTHLRAYQNHPKAKLVAVSDRIKHRLEGDLSGVQGNFLEAGERFDFSGVNTYETVNGLLDDPQVELVSICLPTHLHAEVTREALAKGKHVLCEKPMALTAKEVDSMVTAASESEPKLMVAQCIRFWPEFLKAYEIIQNGELGRVLSARLERHSPLPPWGEWLQDESRSGGMILDLSIHDVDFAQYLLGVPEKVSAIGSCDLPRGFDHYEGRLSYPDSVVSIDGGWLFRGDYPFYMAFEILCEEGLLSYHSLLNRPLTLFRANGKKEQPDLPPGDGYSREIDYFLSCIEKGQEPEKSPPAESALSVKLALLLKEARQKGGVELEVPGGWR